MKTKISSEKGFTLIETIGAVFVMTIGVIGSYYIVQYSISSNNYARAKLTASSLAQEGIEIVRNIRDSNWLEMRYGLDTQWNDDLGVGEYEGDYQIDTEENPQTLMVCVNPCSYAGNLRFLRSNAGFYNYSEGEDTIFKRKISIVQSTDSFIEVVVGVFWESSGEKMNYVSVQEILYNWH